MKHRNVWLISFLAGLMFVLMACERDRAGHIDAQTMADALHSVLEANRTVYTRLIINRLTREEQVIQVSEHWQTEKALVLPAQMFRYGAERVAQQGSPFEYALLSAWPINRQNRPVTEIEQQGLAYVAEHPGKNFYSEEKLDGVTYFTAVYADVAVAPACVSCHNAHKDSPRTDFRIGDVMGGIVIRIPL